MRITFTCLALLTAATGCVSDQGFHMEQEAPAPLEEDTAPPVEAPPDLPVAVCDVSPNPITPPFEAATWDGSESYDPNGGTIVDWDWKLRSQPEGSAVELTGTGAVRPDFVPDLAGNYIADLVVTNDIGEASEPCTAILESIPAEDLWVEMYWTHPQDDMDLHLVRPNGQLESNNDCYFSNCVNGNLDWGEHDNPDDDPSLDLDDIPGTGPENINILMPESGEFTVYVHDYQWSTPDVQGVNPVTVNVYLNGSLVWTNTKDIVGEDTYTPFCKVDWEAGTVTTM